MANLRLLKIIMASKELPPWRGAHWTRVPRIERPSIDWWLRQSSEQVASRGLCYNSGVYLVVVLGAFCFVGLRWGGNSCCGAQARQKSFVLTFDSSLSGVLEVRRCFVLVFDSSLSSGRKNATKQLVKKTGPLMT
jgi:hypothetical protein